ncbi:short-chain fatty acids transporter [Marivirga sericea]|uniref:Short-chain fatty acids transporter n=1 Tax=Marivirga sericea TaxID=1028 RepID=A0A1X7KGQ9_9BACT|nr:TIGR00366 family protein [Marivirga sericea]SMG39796.1 short-chain fatty acids transporter [Marivirga sericea]
MSFSRSYIKLVERFLPSPFVIAILLSGITFALALFFTEQDGNLFKQSQSILGYWQTGFWELLAFTMQMVLILLLGHTLALTPFFSRLINKIGSIPTNTAQAAFFISFFTIIMSFLNWGLCLVFGAILSRRIGENFTTQNKAFNYGVLGAAGYSGMMVWHGGLSASAPLKVAEANHFLIEEIGIIGISETLFSNMNIVISLLLLIAVPTLFYLLGNYFKPNSDYHSLLSHQQEKVKEELSDDSENKAWIAYVLGGVMFISAVLFAFDKIQSNQAFMDLNFVNFLLLTFGILLHGSLGKFMAAVNRGIQGVTGIVIQFPLYSGIMGIMKYSGLVILISDFFVSISTATSFPILTFFSAGLVNFFVPSGGGQWAVQGPIVVEAAKALNIPIPKIVMALSYGDQITNMLQPFWALPLLGITQLKAKDILPYSLFALILGSLIFIVGLLVC